MKDSIFGSNEEVTNGEIVSNIAKAVGKITTTPEESVIPNNSTEGNGNIDFRGSTFRACSDTLPVKVGFWTKVRNVLFYDIKVELTPYQQKMEDEINGFLHQDVTFKGIKDLLFTEITFGKKKGIN